MHSGRASPRQSKGPRPHNRISPVDGNSANPGTVRCLGASVIALLSNPFLEAEMRRLLDEPVNSPPLRRQPVLPIRPLVMPLDRDGRIKQFHRIH